MNSKLSREELRAVAERYGFDIKFDSPNPGFKYVDPSGEVKHMSVSEAIDYAFDGESGSFYTHTVIMEKKKNKEHKTHFRINIGSDDKFYMLGEAS